MRLRPFFSLASPHRPLGEWGVPYHRRAQASMGIGLLVGLLLLLMPVSEGRAADTEAILTQLADRSIHGHIQPAYRQLQQETRQLKGGVKQLCSEPTAGQFAKVQTQFRRTVLAYAGIEHIHFGPVAEDYRFERLAYWPDRKGRGLRAVRRVLRSYDETVWKPDALSQKSVALQGLSALEFLLYGKGREVLGDGDSSNTFRCRYAYSITINIHRISEALVAGWQDEAPIVQALLNPAPDHALYRTRKEVVLEFYKMVTTGLQRIHDLKMSPLLGADAAHAKPRRAQFWRSGMTVDVLRQNLKSIEQFVVVSGFRDLLPKRPIDLPRYVDRLFKEKYRAIGDFSIADKQMAIDGIVRGKDSREAFKKLMKNVNHATVGFARNLAVAADLPMGFNAADGD